MVNVAKKPLRGAQNVRVFGIVQESVRLETGQSIKLSATPGPKK